MHSTTRLVWDQCRSTATASAGVREQTTFHADNGCPGLRQRRGRLLRRCRTSRL